MIWQGEGRGKRTQAPQSKDTLMQLLPCGNGIAAGAQDPAFGLIAASGICLPSLYFYALLAGVRMTMVDVVLHTLKSKAEFG